jgi:hypothetical protein
VNHPPLRVLRTTEGTHRLGSGADAVRRLSESPASVLRGRAFLLSLSPRVNNLRLYFRGRHPGEGAPSDCFVEGRRLLRPSSGGVNLFDRWRRRFSQNAVFQGEFCVSVAPFGPSHALHRVARPRAQRLRFEPWRGRGPFGSGADVHGGDSCGTGGAGRGF